MHFKKTTSRFRGRTNKKAKDLLIFDKFGKKLLLNFIKIVNFLHKLLLLSSNPSVKCGLYQKIKLQGLFFSYIFINKIAIDFSR
jgi:hypothetical protein